MKKLLLIAACVAALGMSQVANALSFGDDYSVGYYRPPEPASETAEAGYINTLIDQAINSTTVFGAYTYVRTSLDSSSLPDATAVGSVKTQIPEGTTAIGSINVSGYDYLIGKYDGPQGGGYVWYVGNLTGSQTIPFDSTFTTEGSYGLSHYTLFKAAPGTGVPDGGATAALLGLGMLGLGFMARRKA